MTGKGKVWKELGWLLVEGRWRIVCGILLMMISRLAALVPLISAKFLIDDVLGKHQIALLAPLICAMVGAVLIQALAESSLAGMLARENQRLTALLQRRTQSHVVRLSLARHDRSTVGELVSRIMVDADGIRTLIGTGLVQFVGNILTAIFALIILVRISWSMTMVILAALVAFGAVLSRMSGRLRIIYRDISEMYAKLTGRLTEALGGIRVIKTYVAEESEERVFSRSIQALADGTEDAIKLTVSNIFVSTVVMGLIAPFVAYMGLHQILRGTLTLGSFVTFTMFLSLLIAPAMQCASMAPQCSEALAGLERIQQILKEPLEQSNLNRIVRLPRLRGDVVFENVSFGYEDRKNILHNIDFHAPANSVTALVGPSGAGKSTIISLLAAFHSPTSGKIWIDGIDICTVGLDSYRQQIALILQQDFLFAGTIRENVAFSHPGSSMPEILEACRTAGVSDFAELLPKQYETVIGERGLKLSGGQRQRISIARAILARPKILLMDEPTSSLDPQTEAAVQAGIDHLIGRCTTFISSHRITTIRNADQILVLDSGRIVERGADHALRTRSARYREFWKIEHEEQAAFPDC